MSISKDDDGIRILAPREAVALERPPDNLAIPVLVRHGLEVEYYAPRGSDPQTPHKRDELYVVAAGTASFVAGGRTRPVAAGDFIYVRAREVHRFEDLSADFGVWVVFFGPATGDASRG
jgi:mannose-6-phosphate isomerase-like protein (cupin superfamily)